jgi:cysteinyl-tRNA synthetase
MYKTLKNTHMRKTIFIQLILVIFLSCSKDEEDDDSQSDMNYKQEMRDFVIGISKYAKTAKANFFIVPQNGIELVSNNGAENGTPDSSYLDAIDGNGQEDLFFGYDNDNVSTPTAKNSYLRTFLDKSKSKGKTIFVTDYCSTPANMIASYNQNNAANYVSFSADHRELDNIPNYPNPIFGENSNVITIFSEVKNFLYLINPLNYSSKSDFISAVNSTNYDLLIMDYFFNDGTEFTATEIDQLKNKANGGKRLIISYMSIGRRLSLLLAIKLELK